MRIETALALAAIAIVHNLVVFGIYWHDKQAARNGGWRVKESTLLLLAFAGGGPGALAAQRLLRHKTRKPPFNLALPLFFILQMVWLIVAVVAPEAVIAVISKLARD